MNYVLMVLGMSVVTYGVRATVFVLGERIKFAPLVRMALDFIPVTVLTAIIVPMTVAPHGGAAELTWRNPQLVAALAAILVCALTRRSLLTIAIGLAVFFGWQFLVLH
jgi:branched-subunit amino acid transport protein